MWRTYAFYFPPPWSMIRARACQGTGVVIILRKNNFYLLTFKSQSHQTLDNILYYWFKFDLDRSTMHPKFEPTGIRIHDLQIMDISCHWDAYLTLWAIKDLNIQGPHSRQHETGRSGNREIYVEAKELPHSHLMHNVHVQWGWILHVRFSTRTSWLCQEIPQL